MFRAARMVGLRSDHLHVGRHQITDEPLLRRDLIIVMDEPQQTCPALDPTVGLGGHEVGFGDYADQDAPVIDHRQSTDSSLEHPSRGFFHR